MFIKATRMRFVLACMINSICHYHRSIAYRTQLFILTIYICLQSSSGGGDSKSNLITIPITGYVLRDCYVTISF